MSLDPYSLCPCESGKKLKFCCADIATEMIKALHLHESGQPRVSRKILEKLFQDDPARAWVATSYAGILLSLDEPENARDCLAELLKATPDHPLGRILDATARLDIDGYDGARLAIHRAFTKGFREHPDMIGSLAAGVSNMLLDEGRYMASRQHLAFAMRFVRAEDREAVMMRLLEFDNDKSIPYPLRSLHNLKSLEDILNEQQQAIFKKAMGLSSLGCWSEAATVLAKLVEPHPESADLWANIAMFHAWDGNESEAALTFHKAASFEENREQAVSYETIAQVLDQEANLVTYQIKFYGCESISRLLSALDDAPRLVRQEVDPSAPQNENATITTYQLLDKEPLEDKLSSPVDFEIIPQFIGSFVCVVATDDPGLPEACRLSVDAEYFEEAKQFIEAILGDLQKQIDPEAIPAEQTFDTGWREYRELDVVYHIDEEVYGINLADIEKEKWTYYTDFLWANMSFSALDGKTPAEAEKIPELAIPLAASINVFDSFCDQFNHQLDIKHVHKKLDVQPAVDCDIQEIADLDSCDILEMLRIPIEKLDDEQLEQLFNRTQLINHSRFTEEVLKIVLQREGIVDKERMPRVLHAFIDLARDKFDTETALQRVQIARDWAAKAEQKLEETLQWELRELQLRVADSENPELMPFLENLHHQYLRKLPDLEPVISAMLKINGITPPWENRIITSATGDGSKELWNPDSESEEKSAGKLWLPGQE